MLNYKKCKYYSYFSLVIISIYIYIMIKETPLSVHFLPPFIVTSVQHLQHQIVFSVSLLTLSVSCSSCLSWVIPSTSCILLSSLDYAQHLQLLDLFVIAESSYTSSLALCINGWIWICSLLLVAVDSYFALCSHIHFQFFLLKLQLYYVSNNVCM